MSSILAIAVLAAALPASGTVEKWTPAGVSSDQFESHAAFDPRTGDLYFVRSSPEFKGWRILTSHCGATGWTKPVSPPFAGDGLEADPYFTADGNTLYFISSRSTDGIHRKDLDIWQVERDASGQWGTPQRLPEPLNSVGQEWFPRPAPDGWLYFGSDRPGGAGRTDIWRGRREGAKWTVENLGSAINTAADEYEPLPSADGTRLIVMADGGLYESRREAGAWATKVKLDPRINVNGTEIGALFSPSGHSLMFSRDTGPGLSGEFFVWHETPEDWPPACPR